MKEQNPLFKRMKLLESSLVVEWLSKGKRTQKLRRLECELGKIYNYVMVIYAKEREEVQYA